MKELHIFPADTWIIRQIYNELLDADSEWHFFYEGTVNFLRVGDKYAEPVIEWCKEMNIICIDKGEWDENIETTKKYIKQFKNIFHEFSVLAMISPSEDFEGIADRVIHCFMNMHREADRMAKLAEHLGTGWASLLWEPHQIMMNAIKRSYTVGRIIEAQKKPLDNNNKKE